MSESPGFAAAASRARTMAAALALGRGLDRWSLALAALALAGLLWAPLPLLPAICLLASLLAGGAQKFYALRVAFDAALFRHWAKTWAAAAAQERDPAALAAVWRHSTRLSQPVACARLRSVRCGIWTDA